MVWHEKSPQALMFKYLVPSWWGIRELLGGRASLEEVGHLGGGT